MVWRWASFDPDRNGVRTYCFNGCKEEIGPETDWQYSFSCSNVKHSTDLDTCCDTEDITVRCQVNLPFEGGIKITADVYEDGSTAIKGKPTKGGVKKITEYNGGVIGMHYVRHKDYYFQAKTFPMKLFRKSITNTNYHIDKGKK